MSKFFQTDLTKDYIRDLPLLSFGGDIHVISTMEEMFEALDALSCYDALGFDTETKPTFTKGDYNPTCLIQVSTAEVAYLFRINHIPNIKPLFNFLEREEVLKIGISLTDDIIDLRKILPFTPQGFVDLNNIAEELEIPHLGVRKLAAIILESRISKNHQVSNWEADPLSSGQKKYAATDAWVCLEMYNTLLNKGFIV